MFLKALFVGSFFFIPKLEILYMSHSTNTYMYTCISIHMKINSKKNNILFSKASALSWIGNLQYQDYRMLIVLLGWHVINYLIYIWIHLLRMICNNNKKWFQEVVLMFEIVWICFYVFDGSMKYSQWLKILRVTWF